MSLPSDLTTIIVTGTYVSAAGVPATGQVNFMLPAAVKDATGKVILAPGTVSATLNSAGSISVILACTDNADLDPSGFTYLVTEVIPGLGRAYSISLPHTLGSTVDLAQLAPVAPAPSPTAFAAANTWTATQTFSAGPAFRVTSGAASGDVLTSDASGNATWQAPTGGISPPAGDIGGTALSPTVVSTHLSAALPVAQGGTGNATGQPSGTAGGDLGSSFPNPTVTGTHLASPLPFAQGGTSAASQQLAMDGLAGAVTSGDYLRGNGSHVVMAAIQAADLPASTTSTQGAVILDGTASDIQPDGVAAAGSKGQAADAKHVHPFQPWQFLPETYGAKGDGIVCTVSTAGSSTTITATSAVFTSTGVDGGKYIMIHGADGTGNGPLITTISTVTDSTHAVLAAAPTATVSGCPAVFGTDDTSAINSALAAAGTYATGHNYFAEVLFGAKIYILGSGPTQTGNGSTTPTFNSQLPLPYPNANGTTQKLVIALTGAGDAGFTQYWQSLIPNVAGSALVTMLNPNSTVANSGTFGRQSVIGGPSGPAGFASVFGGGYANVKAVIKNLSVWCPIWTNLIAYDFGYCSQMRVQESSAQIFAPTGANTSAVQPYLNVITNATFTSSIGVGFRTPVNGNNDDTTMDDVAVQGYENGFRIYDHFTAGRLAAIYTDVAVYWNGTDGVSGIAHGLFIQSVSAEGYNGGLLTQGGSCQADITWDAENPSTPSYDVSDSANGLWGIFRYGDKVDNRAPIVSGASNLKIVNDNLAPGYWSSAPAVAATTVATQNTAWRDATVYITSGGAAVSAIAVDGHATGLTLGASGAATARVPSGKNITLTYASSAPTWVWVLD